LINSFAAFISNLFLQKIKPMQEQKSSSTKYWLYLLMWVVVLILFIIFYPGFLWMSFPGIVTNFALALNIMDRKQTNSPEK
jgi:hypothetical protein